MKTTSKVLAPLFAVLLVGGACGGSSETSSSTPSDDVPSVEASVSEPAEDEPAVETSGTEVAIQNFAFAPKKLSVSTGDTVVWTNADDILHTVTSGIGQKQGVPGVTKDKDAKPDGVFDQEVEFEDTFEFTFDKAGTFKYFCAIHPGMVGTVTVK